MDNIKKIVSNEDSISNIGDKTFQTVIFDLYKMSQENAKHIAILNDETGKLRDHQLSMTTNMNGMTTQLEVMKIDLGWTKKILWLIFGSSITMTIGMVGKIVFDLVTR